jgi:PD-(D/E)XK endonuclease
MYVRRMNTLEQGDCGERSALDWLVSTGARVAIPFGHSPDWDLMADRAGKALRIQVKTSTCRHKSRWVVALCTRGGNRSWGGVVKRFSSSRCDYLFVHVGDGRRWFIPADKVEGGTAICLGGPKYDAFEIEPGLPLEHVDSASLDSPPAADLLLNN